MRDRKIAVLIDGGYFKTIFHKEKRRYPSAEEVVAFAGKIPEEKKGEEIFRIYYYDAPFYDGQLTHPISGMAEDYKLSKKYSAVAQYQKELAEINGVAFRKGHLAFRGWVLSESGLEKIKKVKGATLSKTVPLDAVDIKPNFEQKTVDIKIGLDIAWLSSKRLVDALALVTADTDFVPAMKAARREGLHIIVAKIGPLKGIMHEHSDEVRSIEF